MASHGKHTNGQAKQRRSATDAPPKRVLVIDIGGSKIKVLATGHTEPRRIRSGKRMTPTRMVQEVEQLTRDWSYEAISIGYPGLVGEHGPRSEPGNLSSGWVGFDYAAAFGCPVRIVNDAAMQALGSYDGGRMLFLGLGTGLGSTLISDNVVVTLELGQLVLNKTALSLVLGRSGLRKIGKKAWRRAIAEVIPMLMGAFAADYVVIGGGNSKEVKQLPPGTQLGHNLTAFRGGFRLWHLDAVQTLHAGSHEPRVTPTIVDYRLV